MSERNFRAMLEARWAEGKFVCVCVGLDPVPPLASSGTFFVWYLLNTTIYNLLDEFA